MSQPNSVAAAPSPEPPATERNAPSHRAPTQRGVARREAILRAATELFLEQGYAATTLDDVLRRSGGSRQTLYVFFGGKERLFEAIIAEYCEQVLGPMEPRESLDEPPAAMLRGLGERLLGVVLSPDGVALVRTIVAESARAPDLARIFWRLGPERDLALVTRYLAHQHAKGTLVVADPPAAAHRFLAGLIGIVHMRALLGAGEPMDADAIRRHVAEVVGHHLALLAAGARPDVDVSQGRGASKPGRASRRARSPDAPRTGARRPTK